MFAAISDPSGKKHHPFFTRGYSLRGLGIDIAGRGLVLRKNYRNTKQILEAAFPLVEQEWNDDIAQAEAGTTDLKPEFSVREGTRPIVVRCPDEMAESRFLAAEVAALLRYPKLVQHGSRSMAALLNDRNGPAFASIIWSLDKKLQKRLKQRFAFLCTAIGECVPLSRETADVGLTLLAKFCETHNIKDNVRNSVNDVMILAAAITSGEPLDTADTLLSRFAADAYKAVVTPIGGDSLRIDFRRARQGKKRDSAESKGRLADCRRDQAHSGAGVGQLINRTGCRRQFARSENGPSFL